MVRMTGLEPRIKFKINDIIAIFEYTPTFSPFLHAVSCLYADGYSIQFTLSAFHIIDVARAIRTYTLKATARPI